MLNEFHNQQMTNQELLEMANFWGRDIGLDEDIVLWIGSAYSSQYGNRIKVSNLSGIGSSQDTFTITVPKLEIIGKVNANHITSSKLNKIREFIKLNMDLIITFCQEEVDTIEFAQRIRKYCEI